MAITSDIHTETDNSSIDMTDAWQVLLWCREFGLTKAQLEAAVLAVGSLIADLKAHVGDERKQFDHAATPVPGAPSSSGSVRTMLTRSPF